MYTNASKCLELLRMISFVYSLIFWTYTWKSKGTHTSVVWRRARRHISKTQPRACVRGSLHYRWWMRWKHRKQRSFDSRFGMINCRLDGWKYLFHTWKLFIELEHKGEKCLSSAVTKRVFLQIMDFYPPPTLGLRNLILEGGGKVLLMDVECVNKRHVHFVQQNTAMWNICDQCLRTTKDA